MYQTYFKLLQEKKNHNDISLIAIFLNTAFVGSDFHLLQCNYILQSHFNTKDTTMRWNVAYIIFPCMLLNINHISWGTLKDRDGT
jgi:hypothetical protein